MTTAKDIATRLDGLHPDFLDWEQSYELREEAKAAGLVIVYRTDDTWVSMEGAIQSEAYGDEPFFVHAGGIAPHRQLIIEQTSELLEDELTAELEEMLALRRRSVRVIAVKHCEADAEFFWTFDTTIPHETFSQPVDGKPWCQGIVFALADAVPPSPTWEPYIDPSVSLPRGYSLEREFASGSPTGRLRFQRICPPRGRGEPFAHANLATEVARAFEDRALRERNWERQQVELQRELELARSKNLRITVSGGAGAGKTTVAQAIEALLRSCGIEVSGDAWAAEEGILDQHRDGTLMKVLAKRGVKVEIVEQQQRWHGVEGQGDR